MTDMKQTTLNKLLKIWTLFIGIGAVWGAIMMWIDPSGKMWGMNPLLEMMQEKMPWLPNLYFAFGVLEACTAMIYIKAL